MNAQMQASLKNCKTLPTLPGVAIQILELCQQEDLNLSRMADLIGKDPALSAKVLQIVNSPYYALSRQVATLDHAVSLLGIHAVRTVALSFSIMRGLLRDEASGSGLSCFWRRALISGVAARCLGQSNQEVLFLAAMLQDIGMLALRAVLPGQYEKLLAGSENDHLRLEELEKEELGVDHAEVGGWLVQHWHLPEIFEFSLRGSHDPDPDQVPSELLPIVQIVALSGLFADIWIIEDPVVATQYAGAAAKKMLGMEQEDVRGLVMAISEALPEISVLFEIDLGDSDSLDEILERAKEALMTAGVLTAQHAQDIQKAADKATSDKLNSDVIWVKELTTDDEDSTEPLKGNLSTRSSPDVG